MTNTTVTNFRKNVFEYIGAVVNCNDVINVTTKEGNVVVLSEEEYNGMMETLALSAVPGLSKNLLNSLNEPIEDMMDAGEADW